MNLKDKCSCGNLKKKYARMCKECYLKELGKRRIKQLDKEGNEITIWESIDHIERVIFKRRPHILDVLKRRRKSAYGFVWKYVN